MNQDELIDDLQEQINRLDFRMERLEKTVAKVTAPKVKRGIMGHEIPAGTKVGVLVTTKGVTAVRAAEVLAHMDGLVHVNMDGEAVSVDPSQIVSPDAPAPAAASGPAVLDPADQHAKLDALAEEITQEIMASLKPLQDRVAALEAQVAASGPSPARSVNDPAPAAAPADPAPAPGPAEKETTQTQESTAAAASGDAAAGS